MIQYFHKLKEIIHFSSVSPFKQLLLLPVTISRFCIISRQFYQFRIYLDICVSMREKSMSHSCECNFFVTCIVTSLSSTMTSFVRKSAPIVALYWLLNFLFTYWFINEVLPTLGGGGITRQHSESMKGRNKWNRKSHSDELIGEAHTLPPLFVLEQSSYH